MSLGVVWFSSNLFLKNVRVDKIEVNVKIESM